jgi:hypothetical protein
MLADEDATVGDTSDSSVTIAKPLFSVSLGGTIDSSVCQRVARDGSCDLVFWSVSLHQSSSCLLLSSGVVASGLVTNGERI